MLPQSQIAFSAADAIGNSEAKAKAEELNSNTFGMVGQFPDFCDGLRHEYFAVLEDRPQEITRVLMLIGHDLR